MSVDWLGITYLVSVVAAWPIATRRWFDRFTFGTRRGRDEDYWGAFAAGILTAILWPVAVLIVALRKPFVFIMFGRKL